VQRLGEKGLIWYKRDLRVRDHAPLAAGQHLSATTALFIFEPAWLQSLECAPQHLAFVKSSLAELAVNLSRLGVDLLVREGEATEVLAQVLYEHKFTHLLSHEETGSGWSYARDIAVGQWCKSQSIEWREYTQTGVVRRLRTRHGWAKRWATRMDAPAIEVDFELSTPLSAPPALGAASPITPAAGEQAAWRVLNSFLSGRASNYRRAMSSPHSAQEGCSRLSAHLAFGTISMRCVHQATEAAIKEYQAMGHVGDAAGRGLAYALRGFAGRLRWHCHFMQKLEDEPAIEFQNFSRATDGLRREVYDAEDRRRFDAWCTGQTGYPMVDACMRSLIATGWLNFRMRAMLVSFASYHLWLHWRQTGVYLARQFLDFEPGIHWSQMQMQSGTTGINTLRIYSPTKQALDQDPEGIFIRQWCPELAQVPLPLLAQPWKMTLLEQEEANCVIGKDYPAPIVEEKSAMQFAKDQLYGLRKTTNARDESKAIATKHGSRKGGLPQIQKRVRTKAVVTKAKVTAAAQSQQGDLF
jgi:deoxyribodipyrimidine photo-lyase